MRDFRKTAEGADWHLLVHRCRDVLLIMKDDRDGVELAQCSTGMTAQIERACYRVLSLAFPLRARAPTSKSNRHILLTKLQWRARVTGAWSREQHKAKAQKIQWHL